MLVNTSTKLVPDLLKWTQQEPKASQHCDSLLCENGAQAASTCPRPGQRLAEPGQSIGTLSPSLLHPCLDADRICRGEHRPGCPGHGEALLGSDATWELGDTRHIQAGSRTLLATLPRELEPQQCPCPTKQAAQAGTRGPARGDARVERRTSPARCAGRCCAMAARAALPAAPGCVWPCLQPSSATRA